MGGEGMGDIGGMGEMGGGAGIGDVGGGMMEGGGMDLGSVGAGDLGAGEAGGLGSLGGGQDLNSINTSGETSEEFGNTMGENDAPPKSTTWSDVMKQVSKYAKMIDGSAGGIVDPGHGSAGSKTPAGDLTELTSPVGGRKGFQSPVSIGGQGISADDLQALIAALGK